MSREKYSVQSMRIFLLTASCVGLIACSPSPTPSHESSSRPAPVTPRAEPDVPVSAECHKVIDLIMKSGAVRLGDITPDGAVLLADERWTKIPFNDQRVSAQCFSHRIAGAQNKWIKKITFKNQRTGVVYGTIENTRYRSGE